MTDDAKRLDALDCISANKHGADDVIEELLSTARRLLADKSELRQKIADLRQRLPRATMCYADVDFELRTLLGDE